MALCSSRFLEVFTASHNFGTPLVDVNLSGVLVMHTKHAHYLKKLIWMSSCREGTEKLDQIDQCSGLLGDLFVGLLRVHWTSWLGSLS